MRRLVGFVLLLIVVLFGLSFAMLNAGPMTVDYYVGQSTVPISLALVIALFVGALLGMLAASGLMLGQRREALRLRKRVAHLEKEVEEMRKLPVRDAN